MILLIEYQHINTPSFFPQKTLQGDMTLTENRPTSFTILERVVGLQMEFRYCQLLTNPKEIFSYVTPLSITEIVIWQLDQSPLWNDWEDFNPKPHGKNKSPDPLKSMPNLNIKIILWNIRGGSSDTFIPHALTIIQAQNPSILSFLRQNPMNLELDKSVFV